MNRDWFWCPTAAPGAWPQRPQRRYPLQSWGKESERVLPRSVLSEHGRWSVRASIRILDASAGYAKKLISDEVSFDIFDKHALLQEMKAAPAVVAKKVSTSPAAKLQHSGPAVR
jgi:hypothetical protein